ncbi:Re/Si-specific NAD(P)(+) transhydrogenase subunit alpha [Legionella pneumophila]|uniref:Re/Si-specific NAD(P)(+) transhydrogenase subunit alpha n=1 Tax=Legionella pneumophila TaxID=446 RepID=UPI001374F514|nr:Re/Si-specific NAD(P)(+) transhydrogenase subunit alpha [Legionella pneumophila]HAT8814157.1 Re/Si-specific NAD(P)(+) transhydrogenase subunit alpha [Legionella pneumophila subsp. pneumophila]MCZ4805381.1 Re/Si-specific NAD(P)(+) transhydrogenase subunit alpha [Legionella pneumophila]MDW9178662.1 Re/Si-specific NAD(P)(+) transhydrogenase subunit alpha [Legionella pneumophila]HAT1822992.1 Re/Si-specific NAD(P)(+) transhydrogenase subunit alpha [Legionella pneumophila]HAT1862947.1 Re/Si-speci
MMIATLMESAQETRVAITPNSAKQYIKLGYDVGIEKNAGLSSDFANEEFEKAGAIIFDSKSTLLKKTQILLCVNEPDPKNLNGLPPDSLIIGHIDNNPLSPLVKWCLDQKMTLFSMNLIPRISRAQSMDSLSSQANLAGYRAVLEAAATFHRAIPMMMTAAGMIQPAKVLILGAGVAGLQAIATAKRLGAVVYAFDVRKAAKEQVESLGAEFIEVIQEQDSETTGGYATETSEEYKKLQAELIDQYAKTADIVISTALIPGRQAPVLLYKKTVEQMKPGSVIVDLATSRGGNCELSVADKIIKHGEITIVGLSNMAGLVPATASDLYSNNLVHLINLLAKNPAELNLNPDDEIIQQAVLCHKGTYLPFQGVKEKQNA